MANRKTKSNMQHDYARELNQKFGSRIQCPNCGEEAKHYVNPSLGEPGFYICTQQAEDFNPGNSQES